MIQFLKSLTVPFIGDFRKAGADDNGLLVVREQLPYEAPELLHQLSSTEHTECDCPVLIGKQRSKKKGEEDREGERTHFPINSRAWCAIFPSPQRQSPRQSEIHLYKRVSPDSNRREKPMHGEMELTLSNLRMFQINLTSNILDRTSAFSTDRVIRKEKGRILVEAVDPRARDAVLEDIGNNE